MNRGEGASRGAGASRTPADTLAWAADGAAHLRGLMMRMGDDAFAAPSALPGWSRAHVLSHAARNADAMINLLTWARTGTPIPAYASREQRDADIEAGALRAPAVIRGDVIDSSDRLARAARAMPVQAWSATVRTVQGVEIAATGVTWIRAREMWIHAVDLDVGASFADLPAPMVREVVTDVVDGLDATEGLRAMRLVAGDQGVRWTVGTDPVVEVRGTAPALAAWLLGRSRGRELRTVDGAPLPQLPRWL